MTLSALGIFSAAGAGGVVATGTYELIESTILGSSQSSITFSNLGTYSSTYKHLQIRVTAREDESGLENVWIRFNGDTGANYRGHQLTSNGSSTTSGAQSAGDTFGFAGIVATSANSANIFGAFVMDILDPYGSGKNKTTRAFGGVSPGWVLIRSALWMSTASTTSVTLLPQSTNFVAGSRFSIYGIRG
jgi:hypothetical protein